jgi:phosphosulfolactate synthase (CoM biosynthesis protein A)
MGRRYLEDLLETMGWFVDSLKFAGGSFSLMPRQAVQELIDTAHRFDGFDIIEISSGFITISNDDWLRLVEKVQSAGLKAKPEVGIQFGAGGATTAEELEEEGTRDPEWAILKSQRYLDSGAYMIMV